MFDPQSRITAAQALEHEYFEGLHFPEDETDATPVTMFDFEFEKKINDSNGFKRRSLRRNFILPFGRKNLKILSRKG